MAKARVGGSKKGRQHSRNKLRGKYARYQNEGRREKNKARKQRRHQKKMEKKKLKLLKKEEKNAQKNNRVDIPSKEA